MNRVFDIGDRIEVSPARISFSDKESDKRYVSQLLDFDDIRTAKISTPLQDGRIVPLRVDEDVQLCFFTKSGLYRCRARIKNRYSENNIPVMDALLISEPEKFQRRKFYRLECTNEISYRRMSAEELRIRRELEYPNADTEELTKELEELPQYWKTATIMDLSGGGVRFHGSESMDVGETIEVELSLSLKSGMVSLKIFSHIIECTGESATLKISRCEFDSISAKERELIVKYVFEEQRRRMSGGNA